MNNTVLIDTEQNLRFLLFEQCRRFALHIFGFPNILQKESLEFNHWSVRKAEARLYELFSS